MAGPLQGTNSSMLGGWEVTWEDIAAFPGGLLREVSYVGAKSPKQPTSIFVFVPSEKKKKEAMLLLVSSLCQPYMVCQASPKPI